MDLSTRDGRRILGDRIKRAAKEAGFSLDDLAVRIGCSRALIYQYASGASLAQPDRLQQIALVVGKSLASFFEETESHRAAADAAVGSESQGEPPVRERAPYLRELVDAYSNAPDWRHVADTCQQLIALLDNDTASEELARYLFTHGNALLRLHEFGHAKTKLEEAGAMYRTLGMTAESLDCLQSIGSAEVHLGHTGQAMAAFRRVADGADWHHRWQGVLAIGAVHEMLGDYSATSDALLRAQEIIGENKEARVTDAAYLYVDGNWANLELAWGDYDRALETAHRCVAGAQRLGDQDQYIEALLNCAAARLGLGQLREASVDAQGAVNVAELVRDHERWSLGLASRSLATGSIVDAKESLSIALRYNCRRAELLAQKAIANAYLTSENLVEARYHVEQAIATAELGVLKLPLVEFRLLDAVIAHAEGSVDVAGELAERCFADATKLQAKQARHDAALLLAQIAAKAAEWDVVISYATISSTLAREMNADWQIWRSESLRARALARNGSIDEVGDALAAAVRSIEVHRSQGHDMLGDTLPELDAVKETWLEWFFYLESVGRNNDAVEFRDRADWQPLAAWIEERRNAEQE